GGQVGVDAGDVHVEGVEGDAAVDHVDRDVTPAAHRELEHQLERGVRVGQGAGEGAAAEEAARQVGDEVEVDVEVVDLEGGAELARLGAEAEHGVLEVEIAHVDA
ncbi:MAG: hypothetical protein ACK559_16910, partial [bacterium]